MSLIFPLLAAAGCAVCNGAAAVLQKVSADKEVTVTKLDIRLMLRLAKDSPYMAGVILDLFGWILTFFAVHFLPLFLVESVIAISIAITALIERVFLHRHLRAKSYLTIGVMLLGLVLISIGAAPETSKALSLQTTWFLLLIPVPVALIGIICAKRKSYRAAVSLAALSGLAFGMTSVAARIFKTLHPLWHNIYNPYASVLLLSGALGILMFSVALQRGRATIINASMTGAQTIIPTLLGIVLLGDSARHGLWILVALGLVLTIASTLSLTLDYEP